MSLYISDEQRNIERLNWWRWAKRAW